MTVPKYAVGLGGRGVSAAQDGEITLGIEVGGQASSYKTLNWGKEWPVVRIWWSNREDVNQSRRAEHTVFCTHICLCFKTLW